MNEKAKYILIVAFILSLIIVPKIAFSANELYDSFNYSNTSLAQTAINDEKIEFYPYENDGNTLNRHANGWSVRWVVTSMIASLSLVSGLTPRDLQSLPICAVGILVMAYLVASRLTKDWRLASLYTVMIAFDPTVNSLTNGTYIQGWGFIFYYMLIYVVMVMVEKKHYLALARKREHYVGFLLYGMLAGCALAMMYFSYYSALIYGAIMLAVVAGGILFAREGKPLNRRHVGLFLGTFVIACIGLYFVEPTVRFALANFQDVLSTFFDYGMDVIAAGGARFYVGLVSYLLMFIPILLLVIGWLRTLIRNRKLPSMRTEDMVVAAFILTGVVNIVMYTGLGLVDFKYFIMFFSLAALYALTRLKLPKPSDVRSRLARVPVTQIFAIALALLFIMKFAAYVGPMIDEKAVNEEDRFLWLGDNCLHHGTDTISDLRMSGEIMLLQTEKGNAVFNSFVYSSLFLERLTSGNATYLLQAIEKPHYIVMNDENIQGNFNIGNWQTWESEESPVDSLDDYTFIHRIYSSPAISVWHMTI